MYTLAYAGIDAIDHGDDYALGGLASLEGKVPAWLRAHREMEHSFPSPSSIMNCRLQQWFNAFTHIRGRHDNGSTFRS